MFVKVNKKFLTISKTLAYYITDFITAIKSLMAQAPGLA
jgi:hypothetical protein